MAGTLVKPGRLVKQDSTAGSTTFGARSPGPRSAVTSREDELFFDQLDWTTPSLHEPIVSGAATASRWPSSNERRLGARIQSFGACSGFTRVAARTLGDPPKADLCPRGFDGSVALAVS